jgi:hypothetical protein
MFNLHEIFDGVPETVLTKRLQHILKIYIEDIAQRLYCCGLMYFPLYHTHVQNAWNEDPDSIVPCIFTCATSVDVLVVFHPQLMWFLAPYGPTHNSHIILLALLASACTSRAVLPCLSIYNVGHEHLGISVWHSSRLTS